MSGERMAQRVDSRGLDDAGSLHCLAKSTLQGIFRCMMTPLARYMTCQIDAGNDAALSWPPDGVGCGRISARIAS